MVAGDKSSGKSRAKRKSSTRAIETINPNAAGIDIGSEKHYVAVSAERSEKAVRSFGCYTPDLVEMAEWLKACGITTVAMESTGVYWIPVYQVLEQHGLDVKLVDARHVKNVPGRKTDVVDCQWIQQLHSYGLLRGCFIPKAEIAVLREYCRHRAELVESSSKEILHMQKSLEQMNLHLHKVLSDITGVSGMKIIRAIVSGERNAKVLARMRDPRVKAGEEEIVKALSGNYREEHLFTLEQAVALYDVFQSKMRECDQRIEEYLRRFDDKADPQDFEPKSTSRRKNEPHFDLDRQLYRVTGVNLVAIDGISSLTAQTVASEIGFDVSSFPTEKHFVSWLTLCPENRITGGKVKKRGTRKSSNRLATGLRLAAQSLHHSNSALGAFFRRIKARHGAPKAITATARKLACLIYRMLKYGTGYVDDGQQKYEQRYQEQQIKSLQRRATALGYKLVNAQTGEVS
jgi:transposase